MAELRPTPEDAARIDAVVARIEAIRADAVPAPAPVEPEADDPIQRVAATLEQRRRHAAWKGRDITIARAIERIQSTSDVAHRQLGELVSLWEETLPAELARETRLVTLRGGVLSVVVGSSAVRYELDRRLREGGLQALRSRFRGTLTRVNVRLGALEPDANG